MGIFNNLFNPQPAAPAQQNQQVQPNPGATEQQTQQSGGSTQIASTQVKKDGKDPNAVSSPLDAFNDLWKDKPIEEGTPSGENTPKNPKNKQAATEPDFVGYSKKVDFSKALQTNPELVTKALSGDVQAFGQVMNSIAQAVFAAALKSSHSMGSSRETKFRESLIGELPGHFKSFAVSNLANENPAFNHPAFKPMVDAAKQQALQQYPDATPEEINNMARDYFNAAMEAANPGMKDAKNQKTQQQQNSDPTRARIEAQEKGEYDWSKEMGL